MLPLLLALWLNQFPAQAANLCQTSFDKAVVPVEAQMKAARNPARWKKFADFVKKYGPCLDGYYAESVEEVSAEALVNDWSGFADFVKSGHPDLKVLQKIERGFSLETGQPEQVKKIQTSARSNCPPQIKDFCRKIAETSTVDFSVPIPGAAWH